MNIHSRILLAALASGVFALAGAAPAFATPVQDPHEGHNHPPGQHPKPDPGAIPRDSQVGKGKQAAQKGGPTARLETGDVKEHDFGAAIDGEVLSHTFQLESAGEADLVITSAKPTCGCTVAKLEVINSEGTRSLYNFGDPIPKGTKIELEAQLNTKNKRNVASSKINIFCNDPRSTVTLGLKARVDQYFRITPNSLGFGEMSIADSAQKSFEVHSKQNKPFNLSLGDKPMPQGMKIDLEPQEPTPEGKATRWKVVVTLGPDCREGNLGYPIQLQSDEVVQGAPTGKDGALPTYGATVMVTARVRGLISWEPQYLSFGLVRPGQVVSRTMDVSSFDPEFRFDAPKLRLVGPNDTKPEFPWKDSFSFSVLPGEDNKSVRVELTLNGLPESADGSFQGRLIMETGHSMTPEIAVLFSGVCRPGVRNARKPSPAGTGGQ